MEHKIVVITGGAGFIGSNLAEKLAKNNVVILIDDFSTGRTENAELVKKESVKLIEGSITDLGLIQRTFQGIDYVFHLAVLTSVLRSITDPLASNEINLARMLNVLIATRDNQISRVIYASSSSVYGDTPVLPKREDMVPKPLPPIPLPSWLKSSTTGFSLKSMDCPRSASHNSMSMG
jgi:UDP-glucose 4-epimerase